MCVCVGGVLVAQSCPTLCNSMDCSPSGSSVHGDVQARIVKWDAILFSRGSSQPRDRTRVSCIAGRLFTEWAGSHHGQFQYSYSSFQNLASQVFDLFFRDITLDPLIITLTLSSQKKQGGGLGEENCNPSIVSVSNNSFFKHHLFPLVPS